MKKAVLSSSLNLVVSVIIIVFIVTIGFDEVNNYLENRNNQVFHSNMLNVLSTINYMIDSNAVGSFTQVNIKIPSNQSIIFNNITDTINLKGVFNQEFNVNADIVNFLNLSKKGDYELTICYDCSVVKDYLVIIK